ncbi:MAG: hypothetical protein CL819_08975 [Croceicoccus sp.]|nr:hypothetical protein [Croceicoccus sp.]
MPTATKIAATFRLEMKDSTRGTEMPEVDGTWKRGGPHPVSTGLRLEVGDETRFVFKNDENYRGEDQHACDAEVPEPCESWVEAAYYAHRLSEGRKSALLKIVTEQHNRYYATQNSIDIQRVMSYSHGRGSSAAVLNGCKALAKDGLITLEHENGSKGWGYYNEADSRITGISERAIQYAVALQRTKRPIGFLPEGIDPQIVVDGLTEATREAVVRVAKRVHNADVQGYGHGKLSIYAPDRKTASLYTALEKRGFVRWTSKDPASKWQSRGRWNFEVPADSQLLRIAAYLDTSFATAMLIASEDDDE